MVNQPKTVEGNTRRSTSRELSLTYNRPSGTMSLISRREKYTTGSFRAGKSSIRKGKSPSSYRKTTRTLVRAQGNGSR